MDIVFSPDQLKHQPGQELSDGAFMPAVEIPRRAEIILSAVQEAQIGEVFAPGPLSEPLLTRVHSAAYLTFQSTFWQRWSQELGREHEALPLCWPVRHFRRDQQPKDIDGQLSYFSFDAGTPLGPHTWQAALSSAATAESGAKRLTAGHTSAFSLCRPPGHHAAPDIYGGYCFINNAAIAAEALLASGAQRITILDVDYHHGNGTQAIYYGRQDVQFISIHADPAEEFPHFLGYGDEIGEGAGEGYNLNLPLQLGTAWPDFADAMSTATQAIKRFAPDSLIISLGLDSFEKDPISKFKLKTADFVALGAKIAAVKTPTLFVLEGGYAVDDLGTNCANVLTGFLQEH